MKNKTYFLSFALTIVATILTGSLNAQVFKPDYDTTVYAQMWNIFSSTKEYTYISYPIDFKNGSGKSSSDMLFEAQLGMQFPIFLGRDHQLPMVRATGLFIKPINVSRMYIKDDNGIVEPSYPVRPLNFNPTLTFVHFFQRAADIDRCNTKYIGSTKYKFSWFTIDLAHFSNGQKDSAKTYNSQSLNHVSGNFSTNYLKIGLWFNQLNPKTYRSTTKGLFYQWDMDLFGLFGFDASQNSSYGIHRISGFLQTQSDAKHYLFRWKTMKKWTCETNGDYVNNEHSNDGYKWYFTTQFRVEPTYIIGDLNNYPSSKKNRFSLKTTLAIYPMNWRSLGIFFQAYWGRDYYNIRYDENVSLYKLGFLIDPERFKTKKKPYFKN